MNIAALKTFAPAVRKQLIEAVTRKLDFALTAKTPDYLDTYASQVRTLRELAAEDRKGLIERVAYTWFNRLAAVRYLDARGWHPFHARVLTTTSADETQPELLKLARMGALPEELRPYIDVPRLDALLSGRIPSMDPQGEVYRHLVLAACRFYHGLLPELFERLDDETELLLPDDLLTDQSIVKGFRTEIADEDCDQVEVLGWLYQVYISEKKDEVMARRTAVPAEDIPAVTQLFTPHWIVRYLVENSLGRLWLLNRPGSKLRSQMPYYIEGKPETEFLRIQQPQEIRFCDPAAGSGHMLTYAFDLLHLIYEEEGYAPSEIPALILQNNLYGLEIDRRAAQLASLALTLKARERSPRFLQPQHFVLPAIIELRDVHFGQGELHNYVDALGLAELFTPSTIRLMHQFEEARNVGSLIQPCVSAQDIFSVRGVVEACDLGSNLFLRETHLKVLRVLEQAAALIRRYHLVVANPPYLNSGAMNATLRNFTRREYPEAKADLFAAFIDRAYRLSLSGGINALVTMESWMFLSSFEAFRTKMLHRQTIINAMHMPYLGRGGTSMGINFGTVAAVLANYSQLESMGQFSCVRYYETDGDGVPFVFPVVNERYCLASARDFLSLPGHIIAYWLSKQVTSLLAGPTLHSLGDAKRGLQPGDVPRMVRCWWEVRPATTELAAASREAAVQSTRRWFKFDSGGLYRKWYGNNTLVVDWENDGSRIRMGENPIVPSEHLYFRPAFAWSKVTSGIPSFRLHDGGVINGDASPCFFPATFSLDILALLNSCCTRYFLSVLSPTLNLQVSDILKLPAQHAGQRATEISNEAVHIARTDWNNFETSWDFRDNPLLRPTMKADNLKDTWQNWETYTSSLIAQMRDLEIENNRLFIDAYGLQDELQPDVSEEQITLATSDARRDMAAILSYGIGCIMGRYSLDHPGVILADASEGLPEFVAKVGRSTEEFAFKPDDDGIVPVLDGEWFADDIVARTREFLRATFGDRSLRENIRFMEESLGRDLRSYFLTDFYKDHLQTYKKRPIYWMVQSPRKGFSVLIYLHRYTRDTMNRILNRYLREYQVKLRSRIDHLAQVQTSATVSAREKSLARKESDKLIRTLHECEEWERQVILPLAQARIELDLDDGVKVNYQKLGEALAPIPGLAAAEE